ncbi:MAG: hypothetical protein U0L18_07545 [Acutalibacteraceae bacterium]|jgi:hypothetical protein|nr:hypothetical protein [Acutalibacteraceae bacterium]
MKLYELIIKDHKEKEVYSEFPVLNISNEIWLAFIQEMRTWSEADVYAISFFVDFDIDEQSQILLHFGYNTESQYEKELCDDIDNETIRWNYTFWLQNETFCFGEDGQTDRMITEWMKQQKIRDFEAVEMFVENVVYAVNEIHKSGVIAEHFGKEIPIIIHTKHYYEDIANINLQANGNFLDRKFVEYCYRDFKE